MTATVRSTELSPDEAAATEAALLGAAGDGVPAPDPPGAADGFRYELTLKRDDTTRTARFGEHGVPDGLRAALRRLQERLALDP